MNPSSELVQLVLPHLRTAYYSMPHFMPVCVYS